MAIILIAVYGVLISGCGSDGRLPVSGNVTLDGKPMTTGAITFMPSGEKKTHSSGATVKEGRFSIPADKGLMPGKYRISITPMLTTGRKVKHGMTGKMVDEQILINYKESGKLEATIEAGKENKFDFAITQLK